MGYYECEIISLHHLHARLLNVKIAIRANYVALGLGRIPAGFYAVVHHNDLEWRTENKRSSVNNDVVEWDGPIPM